VTQILKRLLGKVFFTLKTCRINRRNSVNKNVAKTQSTMFQTTNLDFKKAHFATPQLLVGNRLWRLNSGFSKLSISFNWKILSKSGQFFQFPYIHKQCIRTYVIFGKHHCNVFPKIFVAWRYSTPKLLFPRRTQWPLHLTISFSLWASVTRLDENSPNRWLFTLDSLLNITEVPRPHCWATLSTVKFMH
jgi:hypothetical protein